MAVDALAFDPGKVSLMADPLPALKRLQEEDPVAWSERYGAWLITRYDDVRAGMNDQRLTPARDMPPPEKFEPEFRGTYADYRRYLDLWMVLRDPPNHTRLRSLANRAFTPSAIEQLRKRVGEIVTGLIADMPARGEIEFVKSFAYPLPAAVIAELIGVPMSIVDDLKRWSSDLATSTAAATGEDIYRRAARATVEMGNYVAAYVEQRRGQPGNAIIDGLIAARDGEDRLSSDELVSTVILLLFAGHETTTTLLSNGLRSMLSSPGQVADLRAHSDDPALLRNTVEEFLRFDGALYMVPRVAKQGFHWHGRDIAAGDRVFLYNLAANRDPRVFADPDRFDIRRKDAGRHIAFGYGIHFCLGAPLARLEIEVALPALLRRYARIDLVDPAPVWKSNMLLRGPQDLRLAVEAS